MIAADNANILKSHHPNILEFVMNSEVKWLQENSTISPAKNGQQTLNVQIGDQFYYLHSQYDPALEADKFVAKFDQEYTKDKHVLFYGFGLGYYVDAFFRRFGNISFSIYEPYPVSFYQALVNINAAKLHLEFAENIYLEDHIEYYLDNFVSKTKDVLIVVHPVYERIFNTEYIKFLEIFKAKVIDLGLTVGVNHAFEKLWIANSEANFQKVLASPSILREKKGFLKNQTVIMVSAGPSLQDEIENLRTIKDNKLSYIFAVGSAYRALTANGIFPDAVCSYDPGLHNHLVFEDMINQGITEIPLLFGSSIGFETLQKYPGPLLHMITSQDRISAFYLGETEFVGERAGEVISDASTIALLTLEILNKLGSARVILVGQNFAFRNNQYYSEGISYKNRGNELTGADHQLSEEVDSVDGGKVQTIPGHSTGRRFMESYISNMSTMKVINTTRGGAAILGTDFMLLSDVITNYLTDAVVEDKWYEVPATQYNIESIASQHKRLDADHKAIEGTIKLIVTTIKRLETAASLKDLKTVQKIFAKFEMMNIKLYQNSYYQIIIQPMVRVQYAILNQNLPLIQKAQSLFDKSALIIQHYGSFIHHCQLVIRDNELFYQVLAQSVEAYLAQNKLEVSN